MREREERERRGETAVLALGTPRLAHNNRVCPTNVTLHHELGRVPPNNVSILRFCNILNLFFFFFSSHLNGENGLKIAVILLKIWQLKGGYPLKAATEILDFHD